MQEELQFLREQGVDHALIGKVEEFRRVHLVREGVRDRVVQPSIPFYGKEILEMAVAALLEGSNLLLSGAKATGKNIVAENLACIFQRPV